MLFARLLLEGFFVLFLTGIVFGFRRRILHVFFLLIVLAALLLIIFVVFDIFIENATFCIKSVLIIGQTETQHDFLDILSIFFAKKCCNLEGILR